MGAVHLTRPNWASENFVTAMCRIGAALAQALADAHQHGLLHLDIKPSNVLLTMDGSPMLLDFHLARAPLNPGDPPPLCFGGTPPFMSPEQDSACTDVAYERPVSRAVDVRTDIFSLGMLLVVALADESLPPATDPRTYLRDRNRTVSPELCDILARCIASDSANRYQNANHLAEDLRRHVNDEPLAHIPNRSWVERWRKWRRRRPYVLPLWSLGLGLVATVALSVALGQHSRASARQSAETMFFQGQAQMEEQRFAQAVVAFTQARETLPAGSDAALSTFIERRLATARRAHYVQRLSEVVDSIRLAVHGEAIDYRTLLVLDANSKALWADRPAILADTSAPFDARLSETLHRELTELALDHSDLLLRLAPAERVDEYRVAAEKILEEARAISPSQQAIDWWRRETIDPLPTTTTAWESYVLGRALMRRGDNERALLVLRDAVRRAPADFWSNFALASCATKVRRADEAMPAWSVCIGLRPLFDAPFVGRGRTFAALAN